MTPRVKVIHTPDGDKLQDKKTKNLAGSPPKKPRIPKTSKTTSTKKKVNTVQNTITPVDKAIGKFKIAEKDLLSQFRLDQEEEIPLSDMDDIRYFSEEYCDQLAIELNNQMGWPFYACVDNWIKGEESNNENGYFGENFIKGEEYPHDDRCYGEGVNHILVGLPDGRFLDINGIQTREEVAYNWEGTFLRETNGCCFNTWKHNNQKVDPIRLKEATRVLLELVNDEPYNKLSKEHLDGALSNYVTLGEIPDHNVLGTQGYWQHHALLQEIKSKGTLNLVPLYRGASRSPEEELSDPDHVGFLSYTLDRKVAEHFVRFNSGAKLYIAQVGSVKGIPVNDYEYPLPDQAEEYGFSYHDHENEWLVVNN